MKQKLQISQQFEIYVCNTKHLRTSSSEDWSTYLMQSNMKNNMVSVQDDDLKSIFFQRICCQTKQMQPVFRCGGATCTHPRRLTRHAGQDCGQPCLSNGSSTFDFGFTAGILRTTWCNYGRFRSEGPIPDHRRCATRLRSQSTVILCWFGICHAKMKACRWTGWHRSDGTQICLI